MSALRWKPSVTVAAIIEKDGRFLLVEEETDGGLKLNNPAGHLDPGESPVDGCAREALEETAWIFKPTALVGVYLSRFVKAATGEDVTYLRFAFCGEADRERAPLILDEFANTASAGSVIAFHKHRDDLVAGDIGVICSFGAGYSVGSVVVRKR